MRIYRTLPACTLITSFLAAQPPSGDEKPVRVGAGITPPRLLKKVEPEYSPLARADHVQGTVVFQIVVDKTGRAADIKVISPLGFGLDEKAQEAIEKWRFAPGTKNGAPVPILATVEVNFRFPEIWFDEKAEKRRTAFNLALQNLSTADTASKSRAVKSVQDLASEKFVPAMFLLGKWELNGENVSKDELEGWRLIQMASDQNYGPAMYAVAKRILDGGNSNESRDAAWRTLREAATLGSAQAQFFLGGAYERGVDVPMDIDRARRYFRLCAAQGVPQCQFRLAQLLYKKPDRSEDDYVQAMAWYQLSAEQNVAEARDVIEREQAKLTPEQVVLVKAWKSQITKK